MLIRNKTEEQLVWMLDTCGCERNAQSTSSSHCLTSGRDPAAIVQGELQLFISFSTLGPLVMALEPTFFCRWVSLSATRRSLGSDQSLIDYLIRSEYATFNCLKRLQYLYPKCLVMVLPMKRITS